MTLVPLNRILLVEDEPDIRTVAKLALEGVGGFTVRFCGSGSEALKEAPVFRPDLILLDTLMPGMDGPATFHALRQLPEAARVPVIFMTARSRPAEIAQYKALGAADVIPKPFDPMTLSDTIKHIWKEIHHQ